MQGTIRFFKDEVADQVIERIKNIAICTAEAHGCTVEFDIRKLYPAVINHEKEADHIKRLT